MNCEGDQSLVEVKSKFEHEFRRFSIARSALTFTQLRNQVLEAHCLTRRDDIVIVYFNPSSRGVIPLTDDASLVRAIEGASPLLRLFLHRRSKDGSAEYDSESEGHCSECNSDSDHEAEGRGKGGRARGRGQQGGDGGGMSTARDPTQRTHTAGQSWKTDTSEQSSKCNLQHGHRPHDYSSPVSAGSNSGSDLSEGETDCRGKETLLELSPGSGTSDGPTSGGHEQLGTEGGTGCRPATGGTGVRMAVSTSPQDPGLEATGNRRGEDSQGVRDEGDRDERVRGEGNQGDRDERVRGEGNQGDRDERVRGEGNQGDRDEDSQRWTLKSETELLQNKDGCASECDHGSSVVVIGHEQQEPSQLCHELPAHPLLAVSATLKPEPVSYSNTNSQSEQKSHTQTTLNSSTAECGKDPVVQNTVMRVTADMLPPHPLLANITMTTPPSKKTTPPNTVQHTAEDKFPYVVEIYDFDACLKTRDLLTEFRKDYQPDEFRLKWVDDTHALGIFASSKQAWLAAGAPYRQFKTRLVRDGTEQSRAMAEKLAAEMQPSGHGGDPRPQRTAMVARRMVASALGVRVRVSPEQRHKESKELQQARAEKQAHRAALNAVPG